MQMKNLFELCKPREDVFTKQQQDDALDLANLSDGSIDENLFFEETYVTDGMKQLIDVAFQRFAGVGPTGLIRLKQAMGGGKTHNMVALGLLAKHPELRKNVPDNIIHGVDKPIKVISYTGRNSDIQYGIWGEIAGQLGKLEQFSPYYSPLSAPGQNAWIELLKGEPTLIMLDEMPPYLTYLKTRTVGTGTLADVTVNALANLFNAINKPELANVCIVISDLNATYDSGSELVERSFKDLDGEVSRTAIDIEPVRAASDDLYLILKKKLFETLPEQKEVIAVATEYKNAVNKAKQMNYTGVNANTIYQGICEVYPFHPCIKDLFANFKENVNFQQTRGFIRLARHMVRGLYKKNGVLAKEKYLINAYDYDLNDNDTLAMVNSIKPKLVNAISHDICSNGRAAAEEIDAVDGSKDMQEISKMILMASLGDVVGVILGLSISEIIGYMVMPGRDMSNFKKLIEQFNSKAWFLYSDKDQRLFFKDVQNVNAKLNNIVSSFNNEQAKQEIKQILKNRFAPKTKDCYQKVQVFPAIDEIELSKENITLILFEPNINGGLPVPLKTFFLETNYPNRVMFLSGQHDTMNALLEAAKEQKAIASIIQELKADRVPENDTQYLAAMALSNRIGMRINSAMNETFVTLYYPCRPVGGEVRSYRSKEITMNFENNSFNPEEQIRELLKGTGKFTVQEKIESPVFRQKIEAKLFTTRKMRWQDITERAATNTEWNWYQPSSLKDVKNRYIEQGFWLEDGDMLDKEPPEPKTEVSVREINHGDDGYVTLKIIPQNGDTVHWEIEDDATIASAVVKDVAAFRTNEIKVAFICEDSSGKHEVGDNCYWYNNISVQYRFFDANGQKYCELKTNNPRVAIKYSTDGSEPKNGATYVAPFALNKNSSILQAVAYYKPLDYYGEPLVEAIPDLTKPDNPKNKVDIDPVKPLFLNKKFIYSNTKDVYTFINDMKKTEMTVDIESITVSENNNDDCYVDLGCGGKSWDAILLEKTLSNIREVILAGLETKVIMTIEKINFATGQDFKDWIATNKLEISDYSAFIKQEDK